MELSDLIRIGECASSYQVCLDKIAALGIVYYPLNFFVAFAVSFISFPIYLSKITNREELIERIARFSELDKRIRWAIRFFTLRYAAVTGLAAVALIGIQFRALSVSTAIIYGLLGPYVLRERLSAERKDKITEELDKEVEASAAQPQNEIKSELDRVRKDLKKTINEKLRNT